MALFGEKYGSAVRVIQFGDSIELCGGTHASSTGNIGSFKIISESAVAAGIRRIEAITGKYVETHIDDLESQLRLMRQMFGNSTDLVKSIKKLMSENETYRKALDDAALERIAALEKTLIEESKILNGVRLFIVRGNVSPEIIKDVAFNLYKKFENSALCGAYEHNGKANLILMYTEDLVKGGANASKDIKEAAKLVNGGGGGQNFLATAGGKNIDKLPDALNMLVETITKS